MSFFFVSRITFSSRYFEDYFDIEFFDKTWWYSRILKKLILVFFVSFNQILDQKVVHLFVSSSVCLFIHRLVCLFIHPLVCLFIHPSVCPLVCLFIHPLVCMFIHPLVCLFIRSSICMFIHLLFCLFISPGWIV